jgi:hypothetical protein
MIRRIAFRKALLGGAAGALAWEIGARLLILLGVPLLDIVYLLGTLIQGQVPSLRWWPLGMLLHLIIGAIWAIFYAYFFWSAFNLSPTIQGALFSLGPAALAGLVMLPRMGWMHALVLNGQLPWPGLFAANFGWGGPVGIVLGHVVYGLVMGALYTRPVGYSVRRELRHA